MYFSFSNPIMIGFLVLLIFEKMYDMISRPGELLGIVLSIPAILIAITFHEYAHAWVADKLGDDTPRRQGRLTLNPIAHLDPFGVVLLLTAGFGWGKPVEINPTNFNRKVSIRKGNALVSLAGPLMNFIIAIVFTIIYGVILAGFSDFLFTSAGQITQMIILSTISINVGLGVFNLIPLPPLDGSKILKAILPHNAREWYIRHEQILYIVSLVLWITPFSTYLMSIPISAIYRGLIFIIKMIVGA